MFTLNTLRSKNKDMNKDIFSVIPAKAGIQSILKQLKKRKTFSLQADGNSMLPLLHPKDQVFYKKIRFSKIKTNDLVFVFQKTQPFTHRVIYKTDKYLITKGDNNLESDGKIYPQQIVGKITSVRRKNKIIDPEMLYLIQSSLYFKEIVKIIEAFEKNKVSYVFLKGLPVHLYYEKIHPRRLYLDADVLVDKAHYKTAVEILTKFGYKSTDSSLSPTQKKLKNKTVEISFYKLVNGFPVIFDVHLKPAFMMTQIGNLEALYPQKLIDKLTNEFLKNKQQLTINNQQFSILSPPNLIIYLALHFFHHNFRGAFRLDFLDKVIRKCHPELVSGSRNKFGMTGWEQITQKINRYHLQNFVSPVFRLLKKYYNTPLPVPFLKTMEQFNNLTMKQYLKINIFSTSAGVRRFFLLFSLSPFPIFKKILVFFNPQVIYLIVFILNSKLKMLLKNVLNRFILNL